MGPANVGGSVSHILKSWSLFPKKTTEKQNWTLIFFGGIQRDGFPKCNFEFYTERFFLERKHYQLQIFETQKKILQFFALQNVCTLSVFQ